MENEYIIDLAGAGSEEDIQERIAESLPLPDYYGNNLDALYDVLTEMGDGWHIVIANQYDVDEEVRNYVEDLINVLEDASAVVDDLVVEYDEDEDFFDGDID